MTRWRTCWLKTPCGGTSAGIFLVAMVAVVAVAASHDGILNVDGQNLHIQKVGDVGPPIVFEAGLGNDSSTWRRITSPVAKFARVVLYDRAGLGQSLPMIDPPPLKWSDLRYVFDIQEDCNGKEAIQA